MINNKQFSPDITYKIGVVKGNAIERVPDKKTLIDKPVRQNFDKSLMNPRNYTGNTLINTLQCSTIDDYCIKNPDKLTKGLTVHFFRVDSMGNEHYYGEGMILTQHDDNGLSGKENQPQKIQSGSLFRHSNLVDVDKLQSDSMNFQLMKNNYETQLQIKDQQIENLKQQLLDYREGSNERSGYWKSLVESKDIEIINLTRTIDQKNDQIIEKDRSFSNLLAEKEKLAAEFNAENEAKSVYDEKYETLKGVETVADAPAWIEKGLDLLGQLLPVGIQLAQQKLGLNPQTQQNIEQAQQVQYPQVERITPLNEILNQTNNGYKQNINN